MKAHILSLALFGSGIGGLTGGVWWASANGVGLPGRIDKPVSIRESSTPTQGRGRPGVGAAAWYFAGRSHSGGGFHGGK